MEIGLAEHRLALHVILLSVHALQHDLGSRIGQQEVSLRADNQNAQIDTLGLPQIPQERKELGPTSYFPMPSREPE